MSLPTMFRRWIEANGWSRPHDAAAQRWFSLSRSGSERLCHSERSEESTNGSQILRRPTRRVDAYQDDRGKFPSKLRLVRRAFTLVEILLTLAILVIISALVWPTVQNTLAGRRLQSAVDAMRAEWCQARVQAMRSGRTYAFRYVVGGDRFHLGPQDDLNAASAASQLPSDSAASGSSDSSNSSAASSQAPADSSTAADDRPDLPVESEPVLDEEKSLPEGIRFLAGETSGSSSTASSADDDSDSQDDSNDAWSEPVLFFPDGTTSNARLVLAGKRGTALRLELRGITGTVTVSDSASVE